MAAGLIITIDGPAGSGKSTAARKLAARLEIPYLDTGAMYRVVTLAALRAEVNLEHEPSLVRLARDARYELDPGPTHIRVTLDGHDVSEEIRSMRVSDHTRYVASSPGVRQILIDKQRELGRRLQTLVTEGRDQGSVAFPNADMKFFIIADLKTRAERRLHELSADGEQVAYDQVLNNLAERDRTDESRATAPLREPPGAVRIDTSTLSIPQVVDVMLEHLRSARLINAETASADSHPCRTTPT